MELYLVVHVSGDRKGHEQAKDVSFFNEVLTYRFLRTLTFKQLKLPLAIAKTM